MAGHEVSTGASVLCQAFGTLSWAAPEVLLGDRWAGHAPQMRTAVLHQWQPCSDRPGSFLTVRLPAY